MKDASPLTQIIFMRTGSYSQTPGTGSSAQSSGMLPNGQSGEVIFNMDRVNNPLPSAARHVASSNHRAMTCSVQQGLCAGTDLASPQPI